MSYHRVLFPFHGSIALLPLALVDIVIRTGGLGEYGEISQRRSLSTSVTVSVNCWITYTAGARVVHMRKACNELSIGCETGLILKIAQRVGDSFCHSCCGQLLIKYLIMM